MILDNLAPSCLSHCSVAVERLHDQLIVKTVFNLGLAYNFKDYAFYNYGGEYGGIQAPRQKLDLM